MEQEIIRLSVTESAKFFGLEQRTIRRALKTGEINYVVSRGRYKISFSSLLRWSQQKSRLRNKLTQKGIGQFVERWKISNPLYSPNPANLKLPRANGPAEISQTDPTIPGSEPE